MRRRPAARSMAPIDLDPRRPRFPVKGVLPGTVMTHLPSRTTGELVRFANRDVQLRVPGGAVRTIRVVPGEFEVDGVRCEPVVAKRAPAPEERISASGSIAVRHEARVARGSRILVEGVHDAELVEKVWGDDLRHEGVVVERLDGADDLPAVVADFGPSGDRRLGVLLDHLVSGTKETRIAEAVTGPHVLVTGHPFVDVWQAVKPRVLGLDAWPEVPMGEPWKEGVLARIGRAGEHPGAFWRDLLGRVRSYADLEPGLIGAVEQLIDFVAPPPTD